MKRFTNEDKLLHFAAGAAIVIAVALGTEPKLGMAACLAVAIGKELYDANAAKHSADGVDFLATVAGGLTAMVFLI